MTIAEASAAGIQRLSAAGIDTPLLDARLLLGAVLHTDRTGLIIADERPLAPEEYRRYTALLDRRCAGDCVAYLTGWREFWGLDFIVTPAVLVPRPDTETLVEAALSLIPPASESPVLDLCTGSGAVAIALKTEYPNCTVFAADISPAALEIARQNAERLVAGAIVLIQSDLFDTIHGAFNGITVNPPYIPSGAISHLSPEVRHEPHLALDGGPDGLDIIRRVVVQAKDHLLPGGVLLIEADPAQMALIHRLFADAGYQSIQFFNDLSGYHRVITGHAAY
jgi:release factor glutamine methyltransferase